jgi:hypothetical protein
VSDVEVHLPIRPEWTCIDDGHEWPCETFKARLRERYGCDVVKMSEAMVPWIESARHELVLSALQLHARFVGWIPRVVGDLREE